MSLINKHGFGCTRTYRMIFFSFTSWLLFWAIDLEGVKDLQWREIVQRGKNDHISWCMVKLFKMELKEEKNLERNR